MRARRPLQTARSPQPQSRAARRPRGHLCSRPCDGRSSGLESPALPRRRRFEGSKLEPCASPRSSVRLLRPTRHTRRARGSEGGPSQLLHFHPGDAIRFSAQRQPCPASTACEHGPRSGPIERHPATRQAGGTHRAYASSGCQRWSRRGILAAASGLWLGNHRQPRQAARKASAPMSVHSRANIAGPAPTVDPQPHSPVSPLRSPAATFQRQIQAS